MGSSAMEAVTGINTKISSERGKWKETILKNKNLSSDDIHLIHLI
jgi:hypothetical protein